MLSAVILRRQTKSVYFSAFVFQFKLLTTHYADVQPLPTGFTRSHMKSMLHPAYTANVASSKCLHKEGENHLIR